jgi:hypothetical protein
MSALLGADGAERGVDVRAGVCAGWGVVIRVKDKRKPITEREKIFLNIKLPRLNRASGRLTSIYTGPKIQSDIDHLGFDTWKAALASSFQLAEYS